MSIVERLKRVVPWLREPAIQDVVLLSSTASLRIPAPHFPLGTVFATENAISRVDSEDAFSALKRHAAQDGSEGGLRTVSHGVFRDGPRVLSIHRDRHRVEFLILTESDRSRTRILLPKDL